MITRKNRQRITIAVMSAVIILCMALSCMVIGTNTKKADAIVSTGNTVDLGDLLLSDYKTRTDNNVFDGEKMNTLFEKLTGVSNADYDQVVASSKTGRNSANFREGGKDLVITIGGYSWNIVYLSNTKSDGTGDPIVSLWLADSNQLPTAYRTAQWNTYGDNTNGAYPANMYGTSKIRAVTLNNGGKYATSRTVLTATEAAQDENNPFAIFTMPNSATLKGSLAQFITAPADVEWQRKQTSSTKTGGPNGYEWNFNNDAIDSVTNSSFYPGNNNNYNYQVAPSGVTDRATTYTAWKNDKIWLPSMAEAGWYEGTYIARGIWNTNANQRGNAAGVNSWLRSGSGNYSHA